MMFLNIQLSRRAENMDGETTMISYSLQFFKQNNRQPHNQHLGLRFARQNPRYINPNYLDNRDRFSASWWQSTTRFLQTIDTNPLSVHNEMVEGAVFEFIQGPRRKKEVIMTTDWLEFAVEHLSKAWKRAGWTMDHQTIPYQMFVHKLLNYTQRVHSLTLSSSLLPRSNEFSAMSETIAVIACMPYRGRNNVTRAQVLTATSLAATMSSLIRIHCGRIVIVVDSLDWNDEMARIATTTQWMLENTSSTMDLTQLHAHVENLKFPKGLPLPKTLEYQVHETEIALVVVNCTKEDGTFLNKGDFLSNANEVMTSIRMLPKASLLGLRRALVQSKQTSLTRTESTYVRHWLGKDSSRWNNVYLTEPDSILNTKPSALPALGKELENNKIVIPHRLQPLPHESDLPGYGSHLDHVIPANGNLSHVQSMSAQDKCCDVAAHPGLKPHCGTFWYFCGFEKQQHYNHSRLQPYGFMRLQDGGTGIVTLAGACNGRKCVPKRGNQSCYQPPLLPPILQQLNLSSSLFNSSSDPH